MQNVAKRVNGCCGRWQRTRALLFFYFGKPLQKGLFSGFLIFSFYGLGIVPTVTKTDVQSASTTEKIPMPDVYEQDVRNSFERCYWQEDFALFATLYEQEENTQRMDVPCKKIIADTIITQKKSVAHSDASLMATIQTMTAEHPMTIMAPAIAEYDREIAGLLIGIAKKESNWGKRVPRDEQGKDCFNYWGYKGAGTRGVAMGHGCFGSPEEAVSIVGDRLKTLVALRQTSEPKNMIVWKCGSSCKGHSDESVRKWIADVSLYYDRIVRE